MAIRILFDSFTSTYLLTEHHPRDIESYAISLENIKNKCLNNNTYTKHYLKKIMTCTSRNINFSVLNKTTKQDAYDVRNLKYATSYILRMVFLSFVILSPWTVSIPITYYQLHSCPFTFRTLVGTYTKSCHYLSFNI